MSATTGPAIELLLTMGEELAGKDPARALECLRQAADLAAAAGDPGLESNALSDLGALAIAQGDYDAAGESLERAIALAREGDDDLALARALNALGLLRKRQGAAEDGLAYLRESLGRTSEAAHDDAAAAVRAETLEYLGATYRDTGDAKQAFVYFQEALEIRRASGDEAGIASCRNQLGNLCYRMGQFQDAQRHYQLALDTRRAAGDRSGTASTLNNLAGTAMLLGNLREAASLFEESLAITEELGDPHRIASLLSNIGLLRSYEGRVDEAESLFVAGLEIHRERGDLVGQAHALNNMSDLAVERGRPEEAIRLADECIRTWTRAGRSEALPKPWVNRGRALIELDRLAEARQAAREAIDAAARTGSDEYRAEAAVLLAGVQSREGRPEEALTSARDAMEAAERAGSPSLRARCATELGRLHIEQAQLEEAKEQLERAARLVRGLPHPYDRACIMAEQGRLLAAAGSEEAGAERLRRALREFETLGNRRWQVRTLADLAGVVAAADPEEAERLRARARELAQHHDLQEVLQAPTAARRASPPPSAGVPADALEEIADAWQAAPAGRLLDYVDPLFRVLRRTFRVQRASLSLPPGLAATQAGAAGKEARFLPARDGDRAAARFVLVSGGEPAGDEAGRTEVAMGTHRSALRLALARDEAFEEPELRAIGALGRLASFAMEAPLDRIGSEEAADERTVEGLEGLIGASPAMREVYGLIEQVAPTDSSVLLLGESGTGKELAARAVHARSARSGGPFVAISCPSIPRELIEAELFGHEKGAFTGAHATRPGKVELADGGTLFLDEVGDMAIATQVRLLRFLEEREFQRVGGRETRTVNVRILAATSRDLTEAVERGEFRKDLYYRLNVVPVRMPSLRERREDVPMLVQHFLGRRGDAERERGITGRALEILKRFDWPGNVRELRNAVEYMTTLGKGDLLDEAQIPKAIRAGTGAAGTHDGSATESVAGTTQLRRGETMEARLQEVEAALIRSTLEAADWNQSAAARRLGITESKVRNRMKQYGIRRPGPEGSTS